MPIAALQNVFGSHFLSTETPIYKKYKSRRTLDCEFRNRFTDNTVVPVPPNNVHY